MKLFVVTLVFAMLFVSSAYAANIVYLDDGHFGDTIWAGRDNYFEIALQSDFQWNGISFGFEITSPDGANIDWLENVGTFGTNKLVSIVPGSRMDPPSQVWDLGFLVSEIEIDGTLPDQIMFDGLANAGGMMSGPRQNMVRIHFSANVPSGETYFLCIDSQRVGGMGEGWTCDFDLGCFQRGWPEGGLCWPVKNCPNLCPAITQSSDFYAFHCLPQSIMLKAYDDDGDAVQWEHQLLSGAGSFEITPFAGDSALLTYTPGSNEYSGTARARVRVHDPGHSDCCPNDQVREITVTMRLLGEANSDNIVNIGDVVYLLNYTLKGGTAPIPLKAGDANCDGAVNVADPVYMINRLFKFGPAPQDACCQ